MKKYDRYKPQHEEYTPQSRDEKAQFYKKVSKNAYQERYNEHMRKNSEWQKKTNHFSKEEITKIYWDHLAKFGWKFWHKRDTDVLILSCEECDWLLADMPLPMITTSDIRDMQSKTYIEQRKINHVCKSKAIPKG